MLLPEEITTPRLLLRPYRWHDLDDVMAYADDEEWARYLPVAWPYTRREGERFIASQVLLEPEREARWAVVLDGSVVGGVNLRRVPEHRLAELGYAIARAVWGQGLATEATRAVVTAAFESDPELNRIRAIADARNLASQRVLEKIGLRREGVLRQNRIARGALLDEVWYGVLRHELVGEEQV